MALVAAIAAALAALAGALAVGGFHLGSVSIPGLLYSFAFLPGIASVAAGRVPPALPKVHLPPGTVRIVRYAVIGGAFLVISAHQVPSGAAGAATTAAAVGAGALSYWWPRPTAVRMSVGLAVLSLARPDTNPTGHAGALVLLGLSASVALVACSRLANARFNVLGGQRSHRRQGWRVASEAAVVALALLLGVVLAARMDTQPRGGSAQPQAGDPAERRPPEPLDYLDVLDPDQAGPGGLGAGGDGPNEVILKVGADRPGVLRALTFDEWDGQRWRRSRAIEGTDRVDVARQRFVPVPNDGLESFPGNPSEQRIRIEAPYAGVAVGTPRVYSYELPTGAIPGVDGTVILRPALGKGAEYTAQTAHADPSPDDLRAARTPGPDERNDRFRPAFGTALSADPVLSARAAALVARVTAGEPTEYDKVDALSRYLSTHVTMDTKAPALAAGADPVDGVLFATRPVSPVRLATTLAVLTRAAGIPSRLATGFLPGQRPFFGGDFVVRAGDAHAWVEVPFVDVGWTRFDPSGRIAEAEHQDSLWERLKRAWHRFWPVIVLVSVLVVAFVVRRLVLRRRRLAAIAWVTRFYARLGRVGDKRGRPRRPAETPAEYTTALAEGVLADERLVEVGRVVTAAAWSGRDPAPDTRRWAEQVLEEAARATRPSRFPRRPRPPGPATRP